MSDLTKPRTNDELFLAAISGNYSGKLPAPTTRVQEYLAKIYKNGMGGGGGGSTDLTEVEASISALQTAIAALQETAHTHENKEFLDGLQVYLNKTFSTVTAGYEEADKALAERVTTLETSLGDIQTALENIVEVSE